MSEIERYNFQAEHSDLPELDRKTYDSLVRVSTQFVNSHGEPLYLRNHKSEYGHSYFSFSSPSLDSTMPFTGYDLESLLHDTNTLPGTQDSEVGKVAYVTIHDENMPFQTGYEEVGIKVFTFNEAFMPFLKAKDIESDLRQLPVSVISIDFSNYADNPKTGSREWIDGEWSSILLLPPEDNGVAQAIRIRDYTEYSYLYPDENSEFWKFMNSITAHNYATIREKSSYGGYMFDRAANKKMYLHNHQAGVPGYENLPTSWGEGDEFIDGKLLEGFIGRDGAEAIQMLIEVANLYGEPVKDLIEED